MKNTNFYFMKQALLSLALLAVAGKSPLAARTPAVPVGQAAQTPVAPNGPPYAINVAHDVTFYSTSSALLKMDIYTPKPPSGGAALSKRPGILLLHGGGWIQGDKSFYDAMCRHFAERGYVAVTANYRLAPRWKYPAQVDDAQRAVRWLRAHASDYNLDPDRIGALGDSAGAYLAAMLGTRDTRDNSDVDLSGYSSRVQCVFDLYGPTDFTLSPKTKGVSSSAVQLLTLFFGKKPGDAPDLYREGSPIVYVDSKSAPFYILHGTGDTLVPSDQSERLCEALKTAKVDAYLFLVYKAAHGFLHPGAPGAAGALADEFFDKRLKP